MENDARCTVFQCLGKRTIELNRPTFSQSVRILLTIVCNVAITLLAAYSTLFSVYLSIPAPYAYILTPGVLLFFDVWVSVLLMRGIDSA